MNLERERKLIGRMGAKLTVESDLQDFCAHGEIVSRLAVLTAKALGEDEAFCDEIGVAGMLHDIGKLELADVIYGNRKDIMAVERSKYVRMHPALGIDVLRKEGVYTEQVLSYIANHHENYDGTRYPHHIEGEDILKMDLYNLVGQLMLREENTNDIDLNNFEEGVYFLVISNKNGSKSITKVIKE